jgi:uncharacterized membrane protein YkvA (DUF1232 family)/ribosomal protein S18 acetylase RimI-like enzyme
MEARIRRYAPGDEPRVVEVWHRAGRAAYTDLPTWQSFTLEQARTAFARDIAGRCELWVGLEDDRIVAFLAMRGSYVDRLYVDPPAQRRGWGARFLAHARAMHPGGLELHTHVANHGARALYERNGFVAVRFGTSPPPESAPDVEYRWRPAAGGSGPSPATGGPRPARGWRGRVAALRDETFALYLAARDPRTPWLAKLLVAAIVAYALSPIDLVPDFIPVLGQLDDLVLLPIGIALAVRMVPRSVLDDGRAEAARRFAAAGPRAGAAGVALVVGIWAAAAALIALAVARARGG